MNSARATSTDAVELAPEQRDRTGIAQSAKGAGAHAAPPPVIATWLCGLLQASDSFYPTGSYAHSFGLEGLVQEGVIRDRETLRTFLFRAAVPALRHVELPIAAHAFRAFAVSDWDLIGELCLLGSALKTSREARAASEKIGRQRAELIASLHDSSLARDFLRRAAEKRWPCVSSVAAALEGSVLRAPLEGMLAGIYYSSTASLLSAAMKILRLGQNASQTLLSEALSAAHTVITAAARTPLDEIGWFNPWLDIASARHETADARMFIS